MRRRISTVGLVALSFAAACGYNPPPELIPDSGSKLDGAVGYDGSGAGSAGYEAGVGEAGRLGETGGGIVIDSDGVGGLDAPATTSGVEAGGQADGLHDGALDLPEDVPALAIDGGKDANADENGGAGGAGGVAGTGGGGGAGGAGKDALIATGGIGGGGGIVGTGGGSITDAPMATGGTGGIIATGGITGTGGIVASGGIVATGGSTTGCQDAETKCMGNGVQTCSGGQWGSAVACGPRQTCDGPVGTGQCTCKVDAVCTSIGNTCASVSAFVVCLADVDGCFYESSATTCANGACGGAAGAASCCTNTCTVGATCLSGTSIQTCAVAANGCTVSTTTTCTDGACNGPAGSASCCTNACAAGVTCSSSTSIQTCVVGTNGCTTSSTTNCSTGLVCERYPPVDCLDPNWAEWPMPNGQTDVTNGGPNPESYTDNGDGTLTDNVTGLIWQQDAPATTYAWPDAVAYCPTLTLAGHSDWRLPRRIELVSIVDTSRTYPSADSRFHFLPTSTDLFWSSSPDALSSTYAWYVEFGYGHTRNDIGASTPGNVRCVR